MGEALSISTPRNDLTGHQWNEEKINTHTQVDKNNWEWAELSDGQATEPRKLSVFIIYS